MQLRVVEAVQADIGANIKKRTMPAKLLNPLQGFWLFRRKRFSPSPADSVWSVENDSNSLTFVTTFVRHRCCFS